MSAIGFLNQMVDMVNHARGEKQFAIATEHLNMLCGAMAMFNLLAKEKGTQVVLGEVKKEIFIKVINA